jgi:quinol monooxygenase YgiN
MRRAPAAGASLSITRINEFQGRHGESDSLRKFLISIIPLIEASAGCQSCQLLQGLEDSSRLIIVEIWESVEAHQASVKNIPPAKFTEIMKMLADRPKGAYFTSVL